MIKKSVVAICYDFDGTLSPGNMQEYGFFSGLGASAKNFWKESGELAKKTSADPILAYMKHMIDKASVGNIQTTHRAFREYGRTVTLYLGVDTWFGRINAYAKQYNISVEHYIVSSGLKEMIEGTKISKKFKKIYACSFMYDNNEAAVWPAMAVNYTTKTQFLFRINKGVEDISDNKAINKYTPESDRRVPFFRMIYIGDGDTDIPCMKLVKEKGGNSIAVYDPCKRKKRIDTEALLKEGRVNFVAEADYSENSHIEEIVKAIIDDVASKASLSLLQKKPKTIRRNSETKKPVFDLGLDDRKATAKQEKTAPELFTDL